MNCYFIICDDARDRILALCLRNHYYVFLRFNPAKELLTQRSLAGFFILELSATSGGSLLFVMKDKKEELMKE